jgi:abhydrolase domain-containing protein 17
MHFSRLIYIARRVLTFLAVLYTGLAIYAYFFTDRQIFLPHPASYRDTSDVIKLTSTSGTKISAVYLPNPSAKLTLLVSHGNAEDLGDLHGWLEQLRHAGFSIFAYDYQGYGTSGGRPSEKHVYDDELAAYDYLTKQLHTPASQIVVYGKSVGTGPAVYLAARKPLAGLILRSPILSAFRVVTRVPLLPFDKFPNYKEIGKVHCPVLIIHGTADQLVPVWHGQKLYDLANQPKYSLWVEGADHNDLEDFATAKQIKTMQIFADSLIAAATPPPAPR